MDGYNSFHLARIEQHGVVFPIILKILNKAFKISSLTKKWSSFEVCTVNVFINYCNVHLLGIYTPPNTNIQDFILELHDFLSLNFTSDSKIIIAGDLNICHLTDSNHYVELLNMLQSLSFSPLTCVVDTSNGLNDHISSNIELPFISFVFETDVADHYLVSTFVRYIYK